MIASFQFQNSGMMLAAEYDSETKVLTISFTSGTETSYEDVPGEIFVGLKYAESAGKYFHANIKGKYNVKKD